MAAGFVGDANAAPALKDLGGLTWAGKTTAGPAMLHLSNGKLRLELAREGGLDTLCEQDVGPSLPKAALQCRFMGRDGSALFVSRAKRVEVSLSGDYAEIDKRFTLDRASPIELALGVFRKERGNTSAETKHLGWVKAMDEVARRAASGTGLSAANAAFRELRADPDTTPWSVALEVADDLRELEVMTGSYALRHGPLDVRHEVREIVRSALLDERLLPAPSDLSSAPPDAAAGAAGIVSKVLRPGTAGVRADANDRIIGQYAAWTLDGKLVGASSLTLLGRQRLGFEKPTLGWLQDEAHVLVAGEERCFWVPRSRPNEPDDVVVYDVEVSRIEAIPNLPSTPLDVAAPGADVERSPSGIASKVLKRGTGTFKPRWGDNVTLRQTCWTHAGELLVSNVDLQAPQAMQLHYTLTGLGDALSQMVAGEQRRLWLNPEYPDEKHGKERWLSVPRVCDLELETTDADKASPPAELATPKRASGIACETLKAGTGKRHPRATDQVTVRYRGWTANGHLFANRAVYPMTSPVERLPEWRSSPGWSQAVQRMVEGEQTRCWIPKQLSVHEKLGALAAPTVVEITLEKIHTP